MVPTHLKIHNSIVYFCLLTFFGNIIMITIEMQGRDTNLLLLVDHANRFKTMTLGAPVISIIIRKEDTLLLAMFNHYTAAQIDNCLQRTSAIKVATVKTNDFCYEWKPPRAYHKIDIFCGEQR